jgi:hypothetical protein
MPAKANNQLSLCNLGWIPAFAGMTDYSGSDPIRVISRSKFVPLQRIGNIFTISIMMNVLEYQGYSAQVELDPEDECFVRRLAGINDVIGFHDFTISELKAAFHEAVDDYIETCRKTRKSP